MLNFFAIIFYVLLIDSIGAVILAWQKPYYQWYQDKFNGFAKVFPLSKGWVSLYLCLTLWIGFVLYYFKVLPWPAN